MTRTVYSSHGELDIDEAGAVTEQRIYCRNCDDCITNVISFDLNEWRQHYKEALPDEFDILDLAGRAEFTADESFRDARLN